MSKFLIEITIDTVSGVAVSDIALESKNERVSIGFLKKLS